jgi:Protein of unknown function (DUF3307)
MTAGLFAAVFALLFVAHQVADHWVQTDHQALHKGDPGWPGRRACLAHVITYTLTSLAALAALPLALGAALSPARVVVGLAVSAVTHYVADRRRPLAALAALVGLRGFLAVGRPRAGRDDNPCIGTGTYALDQSFHYLFLLVAALIIGGVR